MGSSFLHSNPAISRRSRTDPHIQEQLGLMWQGLMYLEENRLFGHTFYTPRLTENGKQEPV